MRRVKPFAENGVRVSPDNARTLSGYKANGRFPADEYNWITNDRDRVINNAVEGAVSAGGGASQLRISGIDNNGMPVIRPNMFYGDDNVYMPESPINMLVGLTGNVLSASVGWNPYTDKPILVMGLSNSVVTDGDTSANILTKDCWSYEMPATVESRVVNFGMSANQNVEELQTLTCDGKLYVMISVGSYANRYIFRYDLSIWTGTSDASIQVTSGDTTGEGSATELIEMDNGHIGFGYLNRSTDDLFVYVINKDLSQSTDNGTRIMGGIDTMQKFLRSDGVYIYGSYNNSVVARTFCYTYKISDGTFDMLDVGVEYADYEIVDIMPSSVPGLEASAMCYFYDITGATKPFIKWAGGYMGTLTWPATQLDILNDTTNINADSAGRFCVAGGNLIVSFGCSVLGDSLHCYTVADLSRLLHTKFYDSAIGIDGASRIQRRMGSTLVAGMHSNDVWNGKVLYDGRDLWKIDRAGQVNRVVSPLTRSA